MYLNNFEQIHEMIIADGGSRDGTVELVKDSVIIVTAPTGRSLQMNAGAEAATGDILWFLHADCHPHPHSISAIIMAFKNSDIVGGAFEYNLDNPLKFFRLVEFCSNLKNRVLNLIYGDMGIFVLNSTFKKMNGYRKIPLMEDMDFCKRLKKNSKIKIIPQRIQTSASRWIEEGIIKNLFRNWSLQIAWVLGASPEKLSKWYQFK